MERDRLIFLGLTALHAFADASRPAALPPMPALRAVLAFLFEMSDGNRGPYVEFWQAIQRQHERAWSEHTAVTLRANEVHANLSAIWRSLGWSDTIIAYGAVSNPPEIGLHRAITKTLAAMAHERCRSNGETHPGLQWRPPPASDPAQPVNDRPAVDQDRDGEEAPA